MPKTESQNFAPRVALIGFGEAGESFARAGRWLGHSRGWDVLEARRAAMADCGVQAGADAAAALRDADSVLSLVTANAALAAARDYAALMPERALFLDMNSVSPGTKRASAEAIGAGYVDVAVMAPVDKGLAVPLLLAGAQADRAQQMLSALGFTNIRVVGEEVGRASAIKLCRSVMVKGLEALTAEMVLAASAAGVLDEVLASLDASEKQQSWAERADYNLDRMLVHGERRAAEMREAAKMLRGLGVPPLMASTTAMRQQGFGQLGLAPCPKGLNAKLDAIWSRVPDLKELSEQ
jgi:3-hydroxyisobutyrate dehydrogenase-like beta-hydroxyacid dehydrogenase